MNRHDIHAMKKIINEIFNEWVGACTDEHIYEGMIRVNQWINWWFSEWMNEWMNEGIDEWVSEWVNEWVSEWVKQRITWWIN